MSLARLSAKVADGRGELLQLGALPPRALAQAATGGRAERLRAAKRGGAAAVPSWPAELITTAWVGPGTDVPLTPARKAPFCVR